RCFAAAMIGWSAFCCAESLWVPEAQVTRMALIGPPFMKDNASGFSHAASASFVPGELLARSSSSGPHGHRSGIHSELLTTVTRISASGSYREEILPRSSAQANAPRPLTCLRGSVIIRLPSRTCGVLLLD